MTRLYCLYILFIISLSHNYAQNLQVTLLKTDKECDLGSASISIISGTSPFQILWNNGSAMNYMSNLDQGNYSVKITDAASHDTTINFTIYAKDCEPVIVNHFTPNGDGYNDTWEIKELEAFPEFELLVYNRWGQRVHHQIGQYTPWDGKSFGLPLPDATYYYILFISIKDRNKFVKGDVSILR